MFLLGMFLLDRRRAFHVVTKLIQKLVAREKYAHRVITGIPTLVGVREFSHL
jgi:hypothetical protein